MGLQIIEGTPLAVWALLAGLVALGFSQTRERIVASRRAALLPGVFLLLFAVKYAAGASMVMRPDLAAQTGFVVACSLACGLFSGLFAARGRQLRQARRTALA